MGHRECLGKEKEAPGGANRSNGLISDMRNRQPKCLAYLAASEEKGAIGVASGVAVRTASFQRAKDASTIRFHQFVIQSSSRALGLFLQFEP